MATRASLTHASASEQCARAAYTRLAVSCTFTPTLSVLPIHELLHALLVSVQRLVVVLCQRGSRLPVDAADQVPHLRPVVLKLLGLPLRLGRDLPARGSGPESFVSDGTVFNMIIDTGKLGCFNSQPEKGSGFQPKHLHPSPSPSNKRANVNPPCSLTTCI